MPVADQPSATIVRFIRGIGLRQNRKFGLNRLLNRPLRAGSQKIRQWIRRKSLWIAQLRNGIWSHVAYPFLFENCGA